MRADPMRSATRPLEITQVGLALLRVAWADGHESEYPLALLRRNCRCAACRDREPAPSRGPFRVLGPEPSAAPAALEQVGNYGLGIHWSDGHHSIFAFDSLRAECPCAGCAATAAARGSPA